ncbi:MAG: hypothetical protein J6B87_03460 [Clostridia bacterium]|nr:hypothetical protein [Clostridia bacterium]
MKKRIILLITFIIAVTMLAGCNKDEKDNKVTNNNENQIEDIQQEEKPLNQSYDLESSVTAMKNSIGQTATLLTNEEITQKYNLAGIENLNKSVIVNASENNYEEIAIIKLTNVDQQFAVQKMMYERLQTLKEEYKENTEIYNILDNDENTKIKILDNVGIFILSKNADELLTIFDNGI